MKSVEKETLYGAAHAKVERKYFYIHAAIFVAAQIIFSVIVGLVPETSLPSGSYILHIKEWILNKKIGFYENDTVNSIVGVWTSVLIIHFIWAMSYIFFPKKQKERKPAKIDKPVEIKKEKVLTTNQAWVYLLIGGFVEIFWAAGLKADSMSIVTILAIVVSFHCFINAAKVIPIGTSYAVFTGIGTIGTILADIFYFQEPVHYVKIGLICLLALFIVGLKFSGNTSKEEGK